MEIYSDLSIAYNSEGFARLYGWWNDEDDAEDEQPAKKRKKDEASDGTDVPFDGWDEKNG